VRRSASGGPRSSKPIDQGSEPKQPGKVIVADAAHKGAPVLCAQQPLGVDAVRSAKRQKWGNTSATGTGTSPERRG
jgi:hypothetical protein